MPSPAWARPPAVLAFARKFHRREIAEQGESTAAGHERWPVCRVGLTSNTGMQDFNRAILEFFGHPGRYRGTTTRTSASRALDCVLSCEAASSHLDDLHFLKWRNTNGVEVSNHLKWIANEFPVTLMMIGVGLADKGLFTEGGPRQDAVLAQTGRRTTRLGMRPFTIRSEAGRANGGNTLLAMEQRVVLADKYPGMVADESVGLPVRPQHRAHRFADDPDQPGLPAGDPKRRRTAQPRPSGPGEERRGVREQPTRARSSLAEREVDQPSPTPCREGGMIAAPRTLPILLQPVPGEALDSWLEALACRLDSPLGDVLADLGLPVRPNRRGAGLLDIPWEWTVLLRPAEAATIARATGLASRQIMGMTLAHYDQRAVLIDSAQRRVNRGQLWGRARGSRYCPDCLAVTGSRWQLSGD